MGGRVRWLWEKKKGSVKRPKRGGAKATAVLGEGGKR